MRMMIKMLAGAAGFAAIAAAAPAAAQYYPYGYSGYSNYGYSNPAYNYGYSMNPSVAASQCTAAVQGRLYNRTSLGAILGSLVGIPTTNPYGRVLNVTSERPNRYGMTVRGLASSGRYAWNSYGPYGVGAYGALAYGYSNASADLSWRCNVDANGYVRSVDIYRRY
jgi:hypothetical protein